jgi:hypothetical protein
MVAGEVKQLRSLLAQQAAPQLSSTIHLLDGPIAAAGGGTSGPSAHAASKAGKVLGSPGADAASAFPALAAAGLAATAGDAGGRGSEAEDVEGCSDTGLPAGTYGSHQLRAYNWMCFVAGRQQQPVPCPCVLQSLVWVLAAAERLQRRRMCRAAATPVYLQVIRALNDHSHVFASLLSGSMFMFMFSGRTLSGEFIVAA